MLGFENNPVGNLFLIRRSPRQRVTFRYVVEIGIDGVPFRFQLHPRRIVRAEIVNIAENDRFDAENAAQLAYIVYIVKILEPGQTALDHRLFNGFLRDYDKTGNFRAFICVSLCNGTSVQFSAVCPVKKRNNGNLGNLRKRIMHRRLQAIVRQNLATRRCAQQHRREKGRKNGARDGNHERFGKPMTKKRRYSRNYRQNRYVFSSLFSVSTEFAPPDRQ